MIAVLVHKRIIPIDQILQFGQLAGKDGGYLIQLKECQEIVISEKEFNNLSHLFTIIEIGDENE